MSERSRPVDWWAMQPEDRTRSLADETVDGSLVGAAQWNQRLPGFVARSRARLAECAEVGPEWDDGPPVDPTKRVWMGPNPHRTPTLVTKRKLNPAFGWIDFAVGALIAALTLTTLAIATNAFADFGGGPLLEIVSKL